MDIKDACEQAYKNGYEKGVKDFAEKFEEMLNEIDFPETTQIEKTLNICKNISKIILVTLKR